MVHLFGRITKDAIVTEVREGKKVVNFSIALNDSYKPKNGELKKFVTFSSFQNLTFNSILFTASRHRCINHK